MLGNAGHVGPTRLEILKSTGKGAFGDTADGGLDEAHLEISRIADPHEDISGPASVHERQRAEIELELGGLNANFPETPVGAAGSDDFREIAGELGEFLAKLLGGVKEAGGIMAENDSGADTGEVGLLDHGANVAGDRNDAEGRIASENSLV